jgi:hypothetical protein
MRRASGGAASSAFGGAIAPRADDPTRRRSHFNIRPVQAPKFTLSINLKTARDLAVEAPFSRRYSSTGLLHENRGQTCNPS